MEVKDYLVISISGSALIISLISLIITIIQKRNETERAIRKSLSETLENIAKINLEVAKMRSSKDVDFNSDSIIALRRNYNGQRRILIAHADYLIKKYDNLATEIDCSTLANAYYDITDLIKAEEFWGKTVEKSMSPPIKLMNLRGYGGFLFDIEKEDIGREVFKQAFAVQLPENDENRVLKCDTYLMLAELEKNRNKENYDKCLTGAMEVWGTIKNKYRKDEMNERIRRVIPQNS